MSTDDAPVPESPEPQVDPAKAAAQLRRLLETLVPPDHVMVADAFGGIHQAPGLLPARAQIRVMRKVEALLEIDIDTNALTEIAGDGGVSAIAGTLIRLASREEVLDALADAFKAAHPGIVKAAAEMAEASGAELDKNPHPADLFPIEELVAGLLPFFLRLAGKVVSLMATMTEAELPEA